MLVLSFVSPLTQGIRKEFSQVYGLIRNKENIHEQKFLRLLVACQGTLSLQKNKTKKIRTHCDCLPKKKTVLRFSIVIPSPY